MAIDQTANVLMFPSSYKRPGQSNIIDPSAAIMRNELLNEINQRGEKTLLVVSYPEAIAEKVTGKSKLASFTIGLSCGEKIDPDFLKETLKEYKFERNDFVYGPGQYSVRGSIIDVFSYAAKYP
jgi:transcription-repair coupling factor (superfamily II helicase)